MSEQSDTPRQTPLVELLLAVPEDARLIYEHSPTESQSIPVGPMCRQAAMELATATRERDEWKLAARNQAQIVTKIARERDEARAEVAEIEGAFRASGALNQKLLDEVDRLRPLTICGCGDHFAVNFEGTCPNCIAAGKEAKP